MASDLSERALIVGWDGATFDLIRPWADAGYMPNTARLLADGANRVLRSTIPTLSPAAWTSFYTGKNPGRHGTFDFVRRRPGSYDLVSTRNHLPSLGTLFHWVSQAGGRVGAINVPFAFPPEPVNGFMVAGLGSVPEWQFTYPPGLRKELLGRGYTIGNPVDYDGSNDEEYLAAALATTRKRAEVTLELMRREPWNLFMVVFMNIDQLLTFLWHHVDPTHPRHDPAKAHLGEDILELHRILDAALGEMMAEAGKEATVILASDHGMGPLYKEVFLNHWLQEKGYLAVRQPATPARSYNQIMRRLGFTREGIWRRIGRARTQQLKALLPERLHPLVPTEHPAIGQRVDWARTRAYSFGNIGQIYINLVGREPQGIVRPGAEYEQVVAELVGDLESLTDPETGERLVDRVYRREELYDGPYAGAAPDLNVIMRNYSYVTQMRREWASTQLLEACRSMSGFHRREGIFVARGPGIAPGALPPADITAVTPTVLYLMGLPVPDDMDGVVMTDLCTPAFRGATRLRRMAIGDQTRPPTDGGLSAEEEAEILKRLEKLGYLG